ncbi:hypothetical protein D9613_012049 [Agrocybe pediades]|uniref:Uncharacterized protein n=1 Tax=Agrocybe pediades TaxID=84607 RepID=A0A8H4QFE1_9AGAR|nr:hypothetical protein D9613_012049 [Agrocybe pediades]
MPRPPPSFGPKADNYLPIQGLCKTRARTIVRQHIRAIFEPPGFKKPKKIAPHLPGHREMPPQLFIGHNYRERAGQYFQLCTTCEPKHFQWLHHRPTARALRDALPLLDILAEVEAYTPPVRQSGAATPQSSSPAATPQRTPPARQPGAITPHSSTPAATPHSPSEPKDTSSPPLENVHHTIKRIREPVDHRTDASSSSRPAKRVLATFGEVLPPTSSPTRSSPSPLFLAPETVEPLTPEQLERGEGLDLTCPVTIGIRIGGRRYEEDVFPREDGGFRLFDWKLKFANTAFEQTYIVEKYDFSRSNWRRCLWSTPHMVRNGEVLEFRLVE